MLTLSGSLRVFLALEPCDMRKSFDSLHALIVSKLGEDPRGGAVFGFINRNRTLIKLVHWDGTGTWVHANSHTSQCAYRIASKRSSTRSNPCSGKPMRPPARLG